MTENAFRIGDTRARPEAQSFHSRPYQTALDQPHPLCPRLPKFWFHFIPKGRVGGGGRAWCKMHSWILVNTQNCAENAVQLPFFHKLRNEGCSTWNAARHRSPISHICTTSTCGSAESHVCTVEVVELVRVRDSTLPHCGNPACVRFCASTCETLWKFITKFNFWVL